MPNRNFSERRQITVYLEKDDYESIKKVAAKLGMSISRGIREMIDSVLR